VDQTSKDAFHEIDLKEYLESQKNSFQNITTTSFHEGAFSRLKYRVFITDDGHMGLRATAHSGDEVWLLFGGRVLYILRQNGDHFTFVGGCYVHGYMHGEGIDMLKAGKLNSEWVDLR
jgi:hypothetical protein